MPSITSKGQVTIPKPVRDRFGLGPGTRVEFVVEDDRIVVRKASRVEALDRWVGALELSGGADEFLDDLRGKR